MQPSEVKVFSPPPRRSNTSLVIGVLLILAISVTIALMLRPVQNEARPAKADERPAAIPQRPAKDREQPAQSGEQPAKKTIASTPVRVDPVLPIEKAAIPEAAPAPVEAEPPKLEPGLIAYLPLMEDLLDHGPAKMRVAPMGNVRIENSAAVFDGNCWLELPHIAFNVDAFSVAMWIKLEQEYPGYGLVEQQSGGGKGQHLHLVLRDECHPYFGFMMDDLRVGPRVTPESGWTHLVFIYDGDSQQIWLNGAMAGERFCSAFKGSKGPTLIGKGPNWTNVAIANFRGQMREFKIFSRALKPKDIAKTKIYKVPESKTGKGKTEQPDF